MQETLEKRNETKRNETKETVRSNKKRNERIRNADLYEVLLNLEIIEMLSKQKSNSNLYDSKCSCNVLVVAFCYHSDEIKVC